MRALARGGGLALAVLLLAGCGYSLRGTLPAHIQTIAVPIFANRTAEPGVEGFITRAVVEAFSTNGRLRLASRADADAVLDGEVISYSVSSIAFDPEANARLYRLIVTLRLSVRDMRRDTVLLEPTDVREQADFRVLGAVSETIGLEETALRDAAIQVGRAVVSLAVDRF